MKKIIILVVFASSLTSTYAQKWVDMIMKSDANLYEIQKEFNDFFKDKDITVKSTGYKAFKRWEYFVRPRVYPTGNISVLSELSNNYSDFLIK